MGHEKRGTVLDLSAARIEGEEPEDVCKRADTVTETAEF